jgi:cell division protein FtsZ
MGKGTGTGAAPVIAQLAKEQGALTVGVVTKPFSFEGAKRKAAAELGIAEFRQHVDCLITIPNDRLMTFAPKKVTFKELLSKANDILHCAVKGISDVIMAEGLFNVDFADVRTAMREVGLALMGTGVASGENRAREAATRAITSPLLEDVSIDGAKAVLYNITASMDILGDEIQEVGDIIRDAVHPDANVIWGMVFDENAGNELRITVIATGIEAPPKSVAPAGSQPLAAGNVTHFPLGGKYPPAREQTLQVQQTPMQSHAAPAEGTQRQPRRAHHPWYDEKDDRPTYVRKANALGNRKAHPHAPGEEDFLFDEEEFEMPAFIRRQAD